MNFKSASLPSGRTAAPAAFQNNPEIPCTEPVTRQGIDGNEVAAARRRPAATRGAVARRIAADLVQNRWLILRVFAPFVAAYYLSFLFRTIDNRWFTGIGIWTRCR
jgi:hypothetical protein